MTQTDLTSLCESVVMLAFNLPYPSVRTKEVFSLWSSDSKLLLVLRLNAIKDSNDIAVEIADSPSGNFFA